MSPGNLREGCQEQVSRKQSPVLFVLPVPGTAGPRLPCTALAQVESRNTGGSVPERFLEQASLETGAARCRLRRKSRQFSAWFRLIHTGNRVEAHGERKHRGETGQRLQPSRSIVQTERCASSRMEMEHRCG